MDERARVMIIDDDASTRKQLRESLTALGMEITEAVSGVEAILLLSKGRYELILLDHTLPDYGRGAMIEAIRNLSPAPIMIVADQADESLAGTGILNQVKRGALSAESLARALINDLLIHHARLASEQVEKEIKARIMQEELVLNDIIAMAKARMVVHDMQDLGSTSRTGT